MTLRLGDHSIAGFTIARAFGWEEFAGEQRREQRDRHREQERVERRLQRPEDQRKGARFGSLSSLSGSMPDVPGAWRRPRTRPGGAASWPRLPMRPGRGPPCAMVLRVRDEAVPFFGASSTHSTGSPWATTASATIRSVVIWATRTRPVASPVMNKRERVEVPHDVTAPGCGGCAWPS